MSGVQVTQPFQVFFDRNGEPLEAGFIYIGEPNQNPQAVPVQAYFDLAMTIPAAQPIRTVGGYPSYNGSPAKLFVRETIYSIAVLDKNGVFVYSSPSSETATEIDSRLSDTSDVSNGAAMIGRGAQVVKSIAELRTLLKTSPSQTAIVLGYYDENDGGGGVYSIDPFDTISADNGGTIIAAADGARWKLQYLDTVTVKQFGARGDGVSDDTSALLAARDWLASQTSHPKLTFPSGAYFYLVSPNWAIQDAEIVSDGEVRLRYGGTGNAVILDAGSGSQTCFNLKMGRFIVEAPPTGGHGVYVRSVHESDLSFFVPTAGASSAGIRVDFAVLTTFRKPTVTSNVVSFYGAAPPQYGVYLDERNPGETVSYCIFEGISCAGSPIGLHLEKTLGNLFLGGALQGCTTRGMETSSTALRDKFIGLDFEANGVRDIVCLGRQMVFQDCDTTLSVFIAGSFNTVRGGNHETIEVDVSALHPRLEGFLYRRNDTGSLINNSTTTNMRDLIRVDVGGLTFTRHNSVPSKTTPLVGASPFTYTNTSGNDVTATVIGGTVTQLAISRPGVAGTNVGFTSGTVLLSPGDGLVITHSSAPALSILTR